MYDSNIATMCTTVRITAKIASDFLLFYLILLSKFFIINQVVQMRILYDTAYKLKCTERIRIFFSISLGLEIQITLNISTNMKNNALLYLLISSIVYPCEIK